MKDLFDKFPRESTLSKWRQNAPAEFEFAACASKVITHQQAHAGWGYFQDNAHTRDAFQRSLQQAVQLNARCLVFSVPKTLPPHPDTVGKLRKFFLTKDPGRMLMVIDLPKSWPLSLVETLSRSVPFTVAANPLSHKLDPKANMRYFRLGTNKETMGSYRYSDQELREIKSKCDKPLCYVIFNNGPTAYIDALRFQTLI